MTDAEIREAVCELVDMALEKVRAERDAALGHVAELEARFEGMRQGTDETDIPGAGSWWEMMEGPDGKPTIEARLAYFISESVYLSERLRGAERRVWELRDRVAALEEDEARINHLIDENQNHSIRAMIDAARKKEGKT